MSRGLHIHLVRRNFWGPASGGDQQVVSYATHLLQAGHTPEIVTTVGDIQTDEYSSRLAEMGIAMAAVSRYPTYRLMKLLGKLARRLRLSAPIPAWEEEPASYWGCLSHFLRHRPDVVHIIDHWQNMYPISSAAKLNIPILYQDIRAPRDKVKVQLAEYNYDQTMDHWYGRLAKLLPCCAGVAVLSPRLARLFRERLDYHGPMYIMPLIVPEPEAVPAEPRPAERRATFGFAARLERLKGAFVLLDAWDQLHCVVPDAHLKMAGAGEHEKQLLERALELRLGTTCSFLGAYQGLEGKAAYMNSIDVYVLPSFTEGTPNGIIEAMAHGKPIVATEIGGIPDVVTPDCGILVPPGEPDALAAALRCLAEDAELRARMGRAARQRYEELFSPAAVLPLFFETYHQVAGLPVPPSGSACRHPWAGLRC